MLSRSPAPGRLRGRPTQPGHHAGSIAHQTVSNWRSHRARNFFVHTGTCLQPFAKSYTPLFPRAFINSLCIPGHPRQRSPAKKDTNNDGKFDQAKSSLRDAGEKVKDSPLPASGRRPPRGWMACRPWQQLMAARRLTRLGAGIRPRQSQHRGGQVGAARNDESRRSPHRFRPAGGRTRGPTRRHRRPRR